MAQNASTEKLVKLEELSEFPGNPRKHSDAQLEELKRSLNMFGQYRPLVLNSKNQILAGNGMFRAMLALGWTEGKALIMHKLTDAQQKKLVLADNQIARMGFTDYDEVDELLREIGDYEIPGYDPETVAQLLATAEEALDDALEYGVLEDDEIEAVQSREGTYDLDGPSEYTPPAALAASTTSNEIPKHFTAPTETAEAPGAVNDEGLAVCSSCGRPW